MCENEKKSDPFLSKSSVQFDLNEREGERGREIEEKNEPKWNLFY